MLVLKKFSTEKSLKTLSHDLYTCLQIVLSAQEFNFFHICALFISQVKTEGHHNTLKNPSPWNINSNLRIFIPSPQKTHNTVVSQKVHNVPVQKYLHKLKKCGILVLILFIFCFLGENQLFWPLNGTKFACSQSTNICWSVSQVKIIRISLL